LALQTVPYDDLTPGETLRTSTGSALIPSEVIESHERLYRFRGSLPDLGLSDGDLLVAEPRRSAACGELVIASAGGDFFIGHWWKKHGLRQLRFDSEIQEGEFQLIAAVNAILRGTV
jgi:hypothetical protein